MKDDAISREWLKTAIHNFYYGLKHTPTEEDIQAYIDAAPSVSTEKAGRWEKLSVGYGCSECSLCTNKHGIEFYRYCPNCGAKMEVEE